ncbi:MAG: exodeoxyribonuclease VII small subunit [Bacteroidales bacterium]|nr:exodeoxyribonuclease VII small subunit [Lachnoclostridium sp.]MCM1385636.1 exodeoxyribonuclease VII small subunit [Lachnoclostridium sp.]MCM1465960.1 exodeoxyribonuclease VII small subunit [Bacteroidales bacterium]
MSDATEKQSKKSEQLSLEENFAKLDKTIEQLESDDISLEDAFKAYSEGMAVLKVCNDQIDRVEKKVLKLTQEGGLEE